jgi:hypothetical protein
VAYDPNPSSSERVILDGLRECGFGWVTVGRLRGWYRRGLPRSLEQIVYFAGLIEQLGPRHTHQALLVVAGAWPESADEATVSYAFEVWFEREFGEIADDPQARWERLYYRMSRAGGVRRRALQLPGLRGNVVEHDLRAVGCSERQIRQFVSFDPDNRERFQPREFLRIWAAQLPAARAALRESDSAARLNALWLGHMWASANDRPEDTPLHALDVLLDQSGRRLMTSSEVAALMAKTSSRTNRSRPRV